MAVLGRLCERWPCLPYKAQWDPELNSLSPEFGKQGRRQFYSHL